MRVSLELAVVSSGAGTMSYFFILSAAGIVPGISSDPNTRGDKTLCGEEYGVSLTLY